MHDVLTLFFDDLDLSGVKTPQYLYFPSKLNENINAFNKFVKNNVKIFYALKSNNHPPLVKHIIQSGFGFDAASKEEIVFLLSMGTDPNNISFSAPTKKEEDIQYAAKVGIRYYAFDSEEEIIKIVRNVDSPILFARLAAANKDAVFNLSSKFGMTQEYFSYILRKCKKNNWNVQGLTFHVGSQNTASEAWKAAMLHAEELMELARNKFDMEIRYLNIGGGIPAPYEDHIPSLDYFINNILIYCNDLRKKFPSLELFIEPGRAMSANTMALLTKIIDIKPYKKPPVLVVDTGVFNGIIEPIEHLEYPIYLGNFPESEKSLFRIVGFSCEGYDVIRQNVLLPKTIKPGDMITFMYAGAYTFVYNNFHMVPYPTIENAESVVSDYSESKTILEKAIAKSLSKLEEVKTIN